jgi:DNA-binding MarR family transcriptional regulator
MSPEASLGSSRARIRAELVAELLSHPPAAVMRVMRRRPGGAISLVHLHVLIVLDREGVQPMARLAEWLDVSRSSATGIVDRMEERGLVARQRDSSDRRVVRVVITDGGRGVLAALDEDRRKMIGELLDELSDDDLEGFLRGVRAMRRARERRAP